MQGIRFDEWRTELRLKEDAKNAQLEQWKTLESQPVNHFRFAAEIDRFIDEDTIVIGDGGDIVSACAKVLNITQPGQWLDPGPLGCLGVGLPFAIAAKTLFPDRRVLIINGDGSFGFNGFEFDTAARFGLPLVSIVGNDAGWGQIRTPQKNMLGADRAVATSLAPTRYDQVAAALTEADARKEPFRRMALEQVRWRACEVAIGLKAWGEPGMRQLLDELGAASRREGERATFEELKEGYERFLQESRER